MAVTQPAVLFVHGFPFDGTMWRHQVAEFPHWKRIAPDLRDADSVARYADDLVEVLDAANVDQAVVCGLSLGGYILFELLRRHARRVRAAVFCNTKAVADSAEQRRGRDAMIALAEQGGAAAVAEKLLPQLLAPATYVTQPEVVGFVRDMMIRSSVAGIVGALRALRDRPDSTATLATIAVPTLVVAGEDDKITPPDVMRVMAQAISGAQFAVISAAGHLAPLEQPRAMNQVLADFLEGLR